MSTALVLADAGRREGGRWKRGSVSQDSDLPRDMWRVAMAQAGTILDHAPARAWGTRVRPLIVNTRSRARGDAFVEDSV